jgi:hypothetical protein
MAQRFSAAINLSRIPSGLPTTRLVTGGIAGFEQYYEGVAL